MSTTHLRDGESGAWLRMTLDEQRTLRDLECAHGRQRAAQLLGTTAVTFERLVSGAWCTHAQALAMAKVALS